MSLSLEIAIYLDELHSNTDECQRSSDYGGKCIQCREREYVIARLERIMGAEGLPITAYHGPRPAIQIPLDNKT
jgi:hypothetical protein